MIEKFTLSQSDQSPNPFFLSRSEKGIFDIKSGRIISYAQLEKQGNQLVNYLLQNFPKVKRVALFMPQSAEYISCFFALHSVGIAIMPISPEVDDSSSRLSHFLAKGEIDLIISTRFYQQHTLFMLEISRGIPKIFFDEEQENLKKYSEEKPLGISLNENQLNFIVNTSGSTGQPKQILIPRRGLPYCIDGHIKALNLTSQDRIAAFAPIAFDAHIIEMFMAREVGVNLYVVPPEYRTDLTKITKFYQEHRITVGIFVASLLRQLQPRDFPDFRVVVCTGEKIDDTIIEKWGDKVCLFDGYGPAENCIATWFQKMTWSKTDMKNKKFELAKIPETDFYILETLENKETKFPKRVNKGTMGEIYISGKGLALGYTDLKLSAERFIEIPNPDNESEFIRVFKTGDLAKESVDNRIELCGRVDRQFKIYGRLICPEEIEQAIKESAPEKISRVCVVHQESNDNPHEIVAYIELIPQNQMNDTSPDGESVNSFDLVKLYEKMRHRLNQVFIPARWAIVKQLPTTASMKTTISNLKDIKTERIRGTSEQYPQTPLEKEIEALFLRFLGISDTTLFRDDHFFYLGGKSLQVSALLQELRSKYQLRLSYREFEYNATIEQLARIIVRNRNKNDDIIIPLKEISDATKQQPVIFYVIHSVLGNAEKDWERLIEKWSYPYSVYAINARGLKDSADMDNDIFAIAYDYYRAIKKHSDKRGGAKIICGWSWGGVVSTLIQYFFQSDNDSKNTSVVLIDSEYPQIFSSSSLFAATIYDLFEKKLLGQFQIQKMPISLDELIPYSKEKQIYALCAAIEHQLKEKDNNLKLLLTVRNLYLAYLNFRLENKYIDNVFLIAAKDTQEKRKSDRLQWPESVRIEETTTLIATHESIMLEVNNAKKVAEQLAKIAQMQQVKLSGSHLIDKLRMKPIPDINEEELQYYIEANGRIDNNAQEKSFNLFNFVIEQFLKTEQNQHLNLANHRNNKVLLITGPGGSGKTTFCQWLAKKLHNDPKITEIVLYIPLGSYEKPYKLLIENHLQNLGLTVDEINFLKIHHKFIIFLDAADEIQEKPFGNLYTSNRLDLWHADVIISVRSTFLMNIDRYLNYFYPSLSNNRFDYKNLTEVTLTPFSEDDIQQYIKKFLQNPPEELDISPEWCNPDKYWQYIEEIPRLKEIIAVPFLLRVLMECLAKIVEKYDNVPLEERQEITKTEILEAFISGYWDRQYNKLIFARNLPHDNHDMIVDFQNYCLELVSIMYKHTDPKNPYIIYRRGVEPWERFFGNKDPDMVRAREGAPIKRISGKPEVGQVIRFIHDELYDYFVAKVFRGQTVPLNDNSAFKNDRQEDKLNESTFNNKSRVQKFYQPLSSTPALYLPSSAISKAEDMAQNTEAVKFSLAEQNMDEEKKTLMNEEEELDDDPVLQVALSLSLEEFKNN